jgi:predicted nucleic acid-binding protein
VADAGPLIALGRVGRLHSLRDVFRRVLVPDAVVRECLRDRTRPDAQAIREAINKGLLTRARVQRSVGYQELAVRFGDGEAAAITLARSLGARVLLDDGPARAAARELGVEVIGTGGVLVRAKQMGRLAAVKPLLLELQRNGYHLSDAVVREILARCGEAK